MIEVHGQDARETVSGSKLPGIEAVASYRTPKKTAG